MMRLMIGLATLLLLVSAEKNSAQNPALKGLPPGAVPATTDGFTMAAKINGKMCKAHAMMPPEKAEEIVGFYDGDKYIGLPYNKKNIDRREENKFR